MEENQGKRSRRRRLLNAVTAVCLVGLLVSAGGFCRTLWRSHQEERDFAELAEIIGEMPLPETDDSGQGGKTEESGEKKSDAAEVEAQWKEKCRVLSEKNGDFVGWLRIPGTKINYPVMHTPDDQQFYIHRDFNKKDSFSGTPFLGAYCDVNSQSIIVYAHNMNNGTMFGELDFYREESFWREHPIVEFHTEEESREYEIFGAIPTRIFSEGEEGFRYYNYIGDLSDEAWQEFMDGVNDFLLYKTGIIPERDDRLLILSTCSYHVEDGRFVVVAREKRE